MGKTLLARLSEPSSWAAVATAAVSVGFSLDPGLVKTITMAGTGIASLLAFFIPEANK